MKKRLIKILLPLVAMAFLFSGCERELEMRTTYFEVYPGEWQTQQNLGYYYAERQFPEFGQNEYLNGAVMVYFCDAAGYDNQLPYLLPYYIDNGNDTYSGPFFENIRYDIKPGFITFIVQQNDNVTDETTRPSVKMKFKVCVLHND